MAMEDYHPSSRGGGPGCNNLTSIDRRFSECSGDGSIETTSSITTATTGAAMSPTSNITENIGHQNILYMKLFHEFKQIYPKVPDETVSQCLRQYGMDKNRCMDILAMEADRVERAARRFSLQALLSHQMQQQLKLSEQLTFKKRELENLTGDVRDMEMKLGRRQLQLRAKVTTQANAQLENHLKDIEGNCAILADEVTNLTNGRAPLGETSLEFYESLPLIVANNNDNSSPPSPCPELRDLTAEAKNTPSSTPNDLFCSTLTSDGRVPFCSTNMMSDDLVTLAKVLPPPNKSTFYIPITTVIPPPLEQTSVENLPPSDTCSARRTSVSPLGDVTDTVTLATMAGLHAVAGLPSAVSTLPIADKGGNSSEASKSTPNEKNVSSPERHQITGDSTSNETQWSCAECTFLNHPALKECEQCEMPRVMIGTSVQRAHQAQNCFCHPQGVAKSSSSSSSSSSSFSLRPAHSLPSNTSRPITITKSSSEEDDMKKTTNTDNITESTSSSMAENTSAGDNKLSQNITKSLNRDDSSPSESTPCT